MPMLRGVLPHGMGISFSGIKSNGDATTAVIADACAFAISSSVKHVRPMAA